MSTASLRAGTASGVQGLLCRLGHLREYWASMWSSGAECLLEAAMRVAADDVTLHQRVQRTARAMVARQQLEATDDLADLLGL